VTNPAFVYFTTIKASTLNPMKIPHAAGKVGASLSSRLIPIFLFGFGLHGGAARGDIFTFDWNLLTGDYTASPPVLLDLNGDAVPKKIWGATGRIRGVPAGDFPVTSLWLAANYGSAQGYTEMQVAFELGTTDTSTPAVFELDQASFSNDPATGTAKMTYVPAGGAASVPVKYYLGGIDAASNEVLQHVATGYVTEVRLEMNAGLGWSGFGNFYFVSSVAALGPVTGTQAPLFAEVMALTGGSAPFRTPITVGDVDFDPVGQAKWLALGLPGQIADARVLGSIGAGHVGERSGVTQATGDLVLPSNGRLVDRDGDFFFDPRDLDPLGRWFDPPMVSEYSYRTRDGNSFSGVGLPLGIDTVDGKFTLWFDGTSRVVNEGDFFSFRDYRVGGGNLVRSFRITGIQPTVDAANSLAFPVRLAFWNGTSPVKTASFSIRPAVKYRPDNLIGPTWFISQARGNGIYNLTGTWQTLPMATTCSRRVSAYLRIQNDGEGPDRFLFRGTGSTLYPRISYYSGGVNRTGQVTTGTFRTAILTPGASQIVRVELQSLTASRYQRMVNLSSRSGNDGTKADMARILFLHR